MLRQYFWEVCCSYGENLHPLSEEADNWRCHFRYVFYESRTSGISSKDVLRGNGCFYGFSRVAILALEQRTFRVTFPQHLRDGILDTFYNLFTIETIVKSQPKERMKDQKQEDDRIYLRAFERAVEAWMALLDYDWETKGDNGYLYISLTPLAKMWVPANVSCPMMSDLEGGRNRALNKWVEMVMEKGERVFP